MLKTLLFRLEKVVFRLLLAGIFPLFIFLFSLWLFYLLGLEHLIPVLSAIGFVLGILIDIILLKSWINQYFSLNFSLFTAVYVFYSMVVFGIFMGVPVFNLFPALLGGYYYGRKLSSRKAKKLSIIKERKKVSVFTSVVMLFMCILSATFALLDKYTGNNLKGMFNLDFDVTKEMLIAFIFMGGLFLITVNFILTYIMIIVGFKIEG